MGRIRLQSPIMMYYQYDLRVGRFVGLWGVSRGCPLVISATSAPIQSGISQGWSCVQADDAADATTTKTEPWLDQGPRDLPNQSPSKTKVFV